MRATRSEAERRQAISRDLPPLPYSRCMVNNEVSNKRTTSTTYAWRKVRVRTPPQAQAARRPKGVSSALEPWDKRSPLHIEVTYRGGAEAWWQLKARGRVWRRPGHLMLDDVLRSVFDGVGGRLPETDRARRQ